MADDSFQLAILRSDWANLGLGYTYADAFPKLEAAGMANALFIVGTDQIEIYHWHKQAITLSSEGTQQLLAALEPPDALKESARTLNGVRERLGWGDRLDHALHSKGFLVTLAGVPLYGGIFLDATSQMAISYPVIRATLTPDLKARFNFLPVHVAFYTEDPAVGSGRDASIAREMVGDWQHFPEAVRDLVSGWAATGTAIAFRKLLRSPSVRRVMESTGKVR